MIIQTLSISNFRNFGFLELSFSPTVNVLYGRNGSGKTNVLEAIAVLCLGRSQRGAADSVLIRSGEEVYRLEGQMRYDGRELQVAVACQTGGRKRITLNGMACRTSKLYEQFAVVSLGPEDSNLLSGPPSERRNFLDIHLAQFSTRYLADLSDYQRALAQKNAALKHEMDPSPFEEIIVPCGSKIMHARREFIRLLNERSDGYYSRISQREQLQLIYEPSVGFEPGSDVDGMASAFRLKLEALRRRELSSQLALVGPHRDEVAIRIGEFAARSHGSQGQWRLAAVSLKLAVYDLLKERRDSTPLLLLDEIFAELDTERAHALIEAFGQYEQLFLTTAVSPPEPLARNSRRFRLSDGMVEEIH